MTIAPAKTLSVSVQRSVKDVYAFLAKPENFPRWAAGLCKTIHTTAAPLEWEIEMPQGRGVVRFVERNTLGVVDHYVTLEGGAEVYVPLRVVANNEGSEVMLTVFRLPDMTDEQFGNDTSAVQKDLEALRRLLEGGR